MACRREPQSSSFVGLLASRARAATVRHQVLVLARSRLPPFSSGTQRLDPASVPRPERSRQTKLEPAAIA